MNALISASLADRFKDWAIVSDGRAQYVGKVVETKGERVTLSPVFEWICPMSVDPREGTVQRGRLALPLETFASLNELTLEPVSVVRLDGLSHDDAAELERVLAGTARPAGGRRIVVPTPHLK